MPGRPPCSPFFVCRLMKRESSRGPTCGPICQGLFRFISLQTLK